MRRGGGDDLPDIHIGRLPAASAVHAEVMVEKILAYEAALNSSNTYSH
ncbi:MAG: C25 family cysteine peptidase [bacterium]